MSPNITQLSSVRSIQLRLFTLLLRALSIVVLLSVVFLFVLTGLFIGRSFTLSRFFGSPLYTSLETYYLAHGNWEGVNSVFIEHAISSFPRALPRWEDAILLDDTGRILVYHGSTSSGLVGTIYQNRHGEVSQDLQVNGKKVGTLILWGTDYSHAWQFVYDLLRPVVFLSFLPVVLTLVIGLLLMRRVVTPLSEVIAAAHAVAAGDLSTRVQVSGPDDLRALSDSFNHMADTLDRNDRDRRAMLADIAHELRTPLSIIRGRLEGILDGVYRPDDAQIAQVLEETYLLERLVDDLRLLTLAESGQLHFDTKSVNLGELAERAVSLFDAEAAEHNIELTLLVGPGVVPVKADPQRIEQVIGNLLSNAMRYVPDGGRVVLRVAKIESRIEVSFEDNGPGVPEENLAYMFDRFWREERSRSRSAGGIGLGLAIAKQLIEAQGGAIFASNRPGGGLRVGFTLVL